MTMQDVSDGSDAIPPAPMVPPPLVIWHKGCLDGFTSAWVVWRFYQEFNVTPDFHPGVYQEEKLPDVKGRQVIMVDFSYPAPVIEQMQAEARGVFILDHHKSAEKALSRWAVPWDTRNQAQHVPGVAFACFDMARSGAALAWDHFNPDAPYRPKLVEHVQDRDLWKFEIPGTEEICAALYAEDFNFGTWEHYSMALEDPVQWEALRATGEAIMKSKAKEREQLKSIAQAMFIGGWAMPVVNAPWFYASELGNELASASVTRVAATYHDDEDGRRKFSLRSVPGGPDVSEIAAKFGGGGHARAAGFVAPYKGWMGDADDQKS